MLVLVLMLALGLFMVAAPSLFETNQGATNILLALGTSLLASSLFSGMHIFFTNVDFVNYLTERMDQGQRQGLSQVVQYLGTSNPRYLPLATYAPADGQLSAFNVDLAVSLANARAYRFQGLTGYFVPLRLDTQDITLRSLRLSIADPRDQAAMRLRVAREMARTGKSSFDDVVAWVNGRILQCLVGLFEVRARCELIEILVTTEVSPDRFEIFDDDMYVTIFDPATSDRSEFPPSAKFHRDSFIYDVVLRRFDVQFSKSGASNIFRLLPETPKSTYIQQINDFGFALDAATFAAKTEQFRAERDAFQKSTKRPSSKR